MTLMAIGKTPDVWAASAELSGIIDWMTMLKHSDPMLPAIRTKPLGDPVKDRRSTMPLLHHHIHKRQSAAPRLQGGNDPRVPPRRSRASCRASQERPVRPLTRTTSANEGPRLRKRENQIDSSAATVGLVWTKYLKGTH